MSNYSIRDLELLSGIKAHTLRIWEQRYNIIQPSRTDTNIRYYNDQDLKLVLNIALLKDHEYKISEIAQLSAEQIRKEVIKISDRKLNFPDQIQALTIAMIDLDEDRFEKVISNNFLKFGFEKTMAAIVYPLLSRIGTLWVTGSIGPAQEHFISSLIRQKMIVAIDGQVIKPTPESRKYMLFLPDGELHELSLLFTHYMVRSHNHKSIYLGQSLPLEELVFACQIHKPEYIFSCITSSVNGYDLQEYVNRLCELFPTQTILLTGYQVVGQDLELSSRVKVINKLEDLTLYL